VIRPGKHGAVQAVKYQDQLVQLSEAHAALDPMQQLAYMQKMLQLTALVHQQMTAYVSEDEDERESEVPQIAAPRKKMYPLLELLRSGEIENDSFVLGYRSEDGSAVVGKLFDLEKNIYNSVFTVGDQGYGKSAFATLLAAYTVRCGGHLLIIDPELGQPQSLTERLGPLVHPAFLIAPVANTPEKAEALLTIAEAKVKKPDGTPLLLIVDELSMIARSVEANMGEWKDVGKRVLFVCEEFATRGRKRLQRAIVMGQFVQGKRNGGTTLLYSMATMVFHLKKRQSKWALDPDEAAQTPTLARGEVMIIPSDSEEEQTRMQVVYPDEQALEIIAEEALKMRMVETRHTTGPLTSSDIVLRAFGESSDTGFYARNRDEENTDPIGSTDEDTEMGYVRNNTAESASEDGVSTDFSAVTPPTGWSQEKIRMLPGFYKGFGNLDRSLEALEISTSPKNREFARETLKRQGLWKETK